MAKTPMNLSKPAFLAAVSYIIMAFAVIMPFNIGDGYAYSFGYRFLLLLILLIPIALSIYSVNCMYVGKCYVWSWVNAVVIAVWVLLFVLAAVLASSRPLPAATADKPMEPEPYMPYKI
jgi:hypothetical protein